MSKKMKLAIAVTCMAVVGCCGGVGYVMYNTQQNMDESTEVIARLEEKLDEAADKAEKTEKELKKANKKIGDLQEKNEALEIAVDEASEPIETPTPTPEPAVAATEAPDPTITYYPGFPTEAVYTSGNGFLEIVGPDENGICTCNIYFNGNKGNDRYDFSGTLNIADAMIPFSNCTHTWESNGVDGTVNTVYTGGSGSLVYVGNDTWRFDDYTGNPDGGTEFSYMMPYGHV